MCTSCPGSVYFLKWCRLRGSHILYKFEYLKSAPYAPSAPVHLNVNFFVGTRQKGTKQNIIEKSNLKIKLVFFNNLIFYLL